MEYHSAVKRNILVIYTNYYVEVLLGEDAFPWSDPIFVVYFLLEWI